LPQPLPPLPLPECWVRVCLPSETQGVGRDGRHVPAYCTGTLQVRTIYTLPRPLSSPCLAPI